MKPLKILLCLSFIFPVAARAQDFLPVTSVELQPFISSTQRLLDALDYVGAPR